MNSIFFSLKNCHNCLVTLVIVRLPYFQGRLWKKKSLKKVPTVKDKIPGLADGALVCPSVDTEAGVWAIVEIGFYFCLLSATSILSSSPALPLYFHRAGWKLEWNKDVSNGWRQPVSKEQGRERKGNETEMKERTWKQYVDSKYRSLLNCFTPLLKSNKMSGKPL